MSLVDRLRQLFGAPAPKLSLQGNSVNMTKILVLYYSSYGHIETMAEAVAAGAREAGVTVDIRRVPELVPDAVAASSHYKLNQKAPVATVEELPGYDAIIVGSGTRYGRMTSRWRISGTRPAGSG